MQNESNENIMNDVEKGLHDEAVLLMEDLKRALIEQDEEIDELHEQVEKSQHEITHLKQLLAAAETAQDDASEVDRLQQKLMDQSALHEAFKEGYKRDIENLKRQVTQLDKSPTGSLELDEMRKKFDDLKSNFDEQLNNLRSLQRERDDLLARSTRLSDETHKNQDAMAQLQAAHNKAIAELDAKRTHNENLQKELNTLREDTSELKADHKHYREEMSRLEMEYRKAMTELQQKSSDNVALKAEVQTLRENVASQKVIL